MRVSQQVLPLAVAAFGLLVLNACAGASVGAPAPAPGSGVAAPGSAGGSGRGPGASVGALDPRGSGGVSAGPRAVRLGSDGRMLEPAAPGIVPGVPLTIPHVDGPLEVKVIYPRPRQVIAVRDSNFLLGSVGSGDARLTINGADVPVNPNGSFLAWLPVPPREKFRYEIVATRRGDTARTSLEINYPRPPANPAPPPQLVVPYVPTFVELLNSNEDAKSDTDQVNILRPTAAGTYKWFVHPRTVVQVTGERGDWVRVKLDESLEAWLEARYVGPSTRAAPLRRTASNARVVTGDGWTDVRIPLSERAPFLIQQQHNTLEVTFYGTVADIDLVNFPTNDPSVRHLAWEQVMTDRARVTVHLKHAPYGYLTLWERGAFVLRVRRPPVVNASRPLAGRVIAIDPGHPPIGSTGPTGLYEGEATLAVAVALMPMLEAAGATVVMTRTAAGQVALGERAIIARRANAEALVSIHLNAHPDGVNPNRTNGTGAYFFHDHAEPLARALQRGMVRWMGLRDLGINYNNLALARPTWFPAVLAEGAFVILPDQEAALRTPEFQSRYAIGILEGLEDYFRSLSPRTVVNP